MIHNTITSKYKKSYNSIRKQIPVDGKQILKSKKVLKQLEISGQDKQFYNSERP